MENSQSTPPAAGAWIIPSAETRPGWLWDTLAILAGSMLVAICAQISFVLPTNPLVPVTMQTFAVLVVGCALGSRRGALAMVAYIAEGAAGLPVFQGFTNGIALVGPTAGYIVGFVPAAWLAGRVAESGWDRHFLKSILGLSVATMVVFLCGLPWLGLYLGVIAPMAGVELSLAALLSMGFWPYLPGAAFKILGAALILPGGAALRDRNRTE